MPDPINGITVRYKVPCSCTETDIYGNPKCTHKTPLDFPNYMDKVEGKSVKGTDGREKRDIHFSDDLTDDDFELFKRYVGSVDTHRFKREVLNRPTFTKENATLYCKERISNTDVGKLCAKLGANVQAMVNSCSIDLELTGDTSFAISTAAVLLNECGTIVGRNLSSYANESGEGKPKNSLLSNLAERLCPNDCTFNGKCVNSSCICNKGFTSNDCAISTTQIPTLSMLQGNGLCDRRKRSCRKVTVMGSGFLNSTNMTCHVKEFQVVNGSWKPNKTELLFPGIMTDLVLVDCYLPESPVVHSSFDDVVEGTPAAALMISVSNGGEHRSKENLTLISYDSGCMSCGVSSGCFFKCQNNGSCVPHPKKPRGSGYYKCDCLPGFTGDKCETNIDECQSYPCLRGQCIDGINGYTCNCDPGYVGRKCGTNYDDCSSSPCVHGICHDYVNAYRCSCDSGYTGQNCDIDIDECQSSPCQNGACVDHLNYYTCQCEHGFTGYNCEVDIDECLSSPCLKGTCLDGINNFTCNCHAGFTGRKCEENIDDCLASSCGNDIDDCVNQTCGNRGSCVDGVNNYSCNCVLGFTRDHCETDIDYCVNHTCQHGGSRVDGVSNYSCSCVVGFTGDHCETDINDCVNHTCSNGGSCVDGVNSFSCSCLPSFTGDYCETDLRKSSPATHKTTDIAMATKTSMIASATAASGSIENVTCSVKEPVTSSSIIEYIPTSDELDKITTPHPTSSGEPATELVIELHIQRPWNDDLEEEKSDAYKELSLLLKTEIRELYSKDETFVGVTILSFKSGSVVAEFKLIFKTKVEAEKAFAPLKKGVKQLTIRKSNNFEAV
ncbi:hypothetical protein ACROYT_G018840 [Oculina patagonica]